MLGHADISTTQVYTYVPHTKLAGACNNAHPSALSDERLC